MKVGQRREEKNTLALVLAWGNEKCLQIKISIMLTYAMYISPRWILTSYLIQNSSLFFPFVNTGSSLEYSISNGIELSVVFVCPVYLCFSSPPVECAPWDLKWNTHSVSFAISDGLQ